MGSSTRKFPLILGYTIRNKIGEGGFSSVFRAIHYDDHLTAACKVVLIQKDTWTEAFQKELFKEIKVHSQLKHRNILEFLASEVIQDDENARARNLVPAVYMLLEIAGGGDLFDKIVPDVGVAPQVAHFYFTQLIAGLQFMHDRGVCHRDLKPENIMLDINGFLKICDFGLCAVYKHKGMERRLTERCGSLPYVAPELNGDQSYNAEAIDVWGCGVILFALLVGNTPWDEPTNSSPEYMAFIAGRIFKISPWNRLKGATLTFLLRLLTPDPDERITLAEIPGEPWFSQENPLKKADGLALAKALSSAMVESGDMDLINPPDISTANTSDDEDEDSPMVTATHASQFTQGLMLFSQTQGGTRYTPGLTRFYTGHGVPPKDVLTCIVPFLQGIQVKCRQPDIFPLSTYSEYFNEQDNIKIVMKVAAKDPRHGSEILKGIIEIEPYLNGCFIHLQRLDGSPLGWKTIYRSLVSSPVLGPYVLRK